MIKSSRPKAPVIIALRVYSARGMTYWSLADRSGYRPSGSRSNSSRAAYKAWKSITTALPGPARSSARACLGFPGPGRPANQESAHG